MHKILCKLYEKVSRSLVEVEEDGVFAFLIVVGKTGGAEWSKTVGLRAYSLD